MQSGIKCNHKLFSPSGVIDVCNVKITDKDKTLNTCTQVPPDILPAFKSAVSKSCRSRQPSNNTAHVEPISEGCPTEVTLFGVCSDKNREYRLYASDASYYKLSCNDLYKNLEKFAGAKACSSRDDYNRMLWSDVAESGVVFLIFVLICCASKYLCRGELMPSLSNKGSDLSNRLNYGSNAQ